MTQLFLLVLLSLTLNNMLFSQDNSWQLIYDADDIRVEEKNDIDAKLLSFRAKTQLKAPMFKVQETLSDTPSFSKWAPDVKEARLIKKISSDDFSALLVIKTPWPIKDREIFYQVKIISDQNNKTAVAYLESIEDLKLPVLLGRVRAYTKSIVTLRAIADEQATEITLEAYTDPKGSLPSWLFNFFQRKWPVNYLHNLKNYIYNQLGSHGADGVK